MEKKIKYARMLFAGIYIVLFLVLDKIYGQWFIDNRLTIVLPVTLVVYVILTYDIFIEAIEGMVKEHDFFNENTLIIIASLGAFIVGSFPDANNEYNVDNYYEGLIVNLLYMLGECFEDYAVDKSKKEIASLAKLKSYKQRLKNENGEYYFKDIDDVNVDEIIYFFPGEQVSLDIELMNKKALFDQKALSGESVPVEKLKGEQVYSGSINLDQACAGRVIKNSKDSTINKIIDLIQQATENKAKSEKFIKKFASFYTPIVICLSVLVAIIGGWASGNWMHWLYQACVLLVVACPCAIVISVPMAYVLSIARASKKGILVKGGNYLDIINKSKVICFDKTGTLTKGELKISAVVPLNGKTEDEILSIAASLELNSTHPIAYAINALADSKKVKILDLDITENAGMEIYALDGKGNKYEIGNKKILKDHSLDDKLTSTNVVILLNGICIGYILLEDTLKNDIKEKIAQIYASGINEEIILSGDNKFAVANCAKDLGINEYYPELLPEEKVEKLKSLLNEKKNVMFVGDGINDAPSIALSSCGISMGNIGSDVAIQTSDIVILDDDISKIAFLKKLSRINNFIVYSNIIAAILVKVIVMILAIVLPNGIPLWLAIFADVGMLILCILHSLTLIKRRIKY